MTAKPWEPPSPEPDPGPQPSASLQGHRPAHASEDDVSCWVCGGPVLRRHCKIVCPRCGFTRDCSDP